MDMMKFARIGQGPTNLHVFMSAIICAILASSADCFLQTVTDGSTVVGFRFRSSVLCCHGDSLSLRYKQTLCDWRVAL